ncbi:RNA polymerase sigma factor [Fontivita pretiosa]|uniref:RNA polymerase sigma factor n=1 Tax=Fontivita pretiosa TaxID=2989684 RepID=UPI003D1731B8
MPPQPRDEHAQPTPDTTAALTAAMAAGDERAVEQFYRAYFDRLYSLARKITWRDESFCLDVVQDAVLRIIRTIRPVQTEAQLLAWLRLVVQTTAYDHLRIERRRVHHEAEMIELRSCDDFPYGLWDDDQQQWLKERLEEFDPQLVQMIELRFERQWTLKRIGELFGLSIGTIDGRLRRAIQELRERAAEELEPLE